MTFPADETPAPGRGRRSFIALAVVIALSVVAAVAIAIAANRTGDEPASAPSPTATAGSAAASPTPSSTPSSQAVPLGPGELIVTSTVEELGLYAAPGDETPVATYGAWSAYGSPTTLMGFATQSVAGTEWIQVELVGSPNHREAWVRADDVETSSTTVAVHIYLAERELDVVDGGDVELTSEVVIGAPESPTPLGTFFITDPLDFSSNPSGVYGAYALGTNGYSETLDEFNGGDPQIAIHGTNEPELMGQDVSNGCIRVPNDVVLEIAEAVDLGTPVIIHASRADSV